MGSSTVSLDGYNSYTLSVSRTLNVKANKSTFTATGTLNVVRNGHVRSDYGTTVWAHDGSKLYNQYDLTQGSYSYTKTFDIAHDANGYLSQQTIGGGCYGGWGSVSTTVTEGEARIDRSGITISNYTLRDCVSKQLYINFAFNAVPKDESVKYRYRKTSEADWETDWITWNQEGGSYDSNTKTGYFITPKLKAGTEYIIELKATRDYNDVTTSVSGNFLVESSIYIKKNDEWIDGEVYIKKNGSWKKGSVYIKKNGVWKEAG